MTRHRYVFVHGELVEVLPDYAPPLRADAGALWGDRSYSGLRASDGTDISTRSRHRDYMKKNNLTTMDDFREEWKRAAKDREARLAGADPSRKHDIADVVYGRMPFTRIKRREDDPL